MYGLNGSAPALCRREVILVEDTAAGCTSVRAKLARTGATTQQGGAALDYQSTFVLSQIYTL